MSIPGAIVAGLAGTVVMSLALAMAPQMGMPRIDFVGLLGSLFSPSPNRVLGWIVHLCIGAVFACIYAALWSAGVGSPDVTIGALFGIAHWLIAGLLIGPLGSVTAGVRSGTLKAPGIYLLNLGGNMGFFGGLMGHIIFGLTVGLVYQIFRV